MASGKGNGTAERLEPFKQEDCEWGTPEYLCVKVEDCEGAISDLKEEEFEVELVQIKDEDSEDLPVSFELQKHEIENNTSEDSYSCVQPWFTNIGQLLSQRNSVELKSEISEFEGKTTEGNSREAEEQQSSRSFDVQENNSFSPPFFAQRRPQHKQDMEKMKKSTSGSENLTSASATFKQREALNTDQQGVPSTEQEALSAGQEGRKTFQNKSECSNHTLNHARLKPYCCSKCGKRFSYSNDLQKHTRIHTGEKPYGCTVCGKRFSNSSNLQKHTRIHTGEKPYGCSECGKRFSNSSHLQHHKRTHTGDKPYCCFECGKRFSSSSGLQTHTRAHTGEKPYDCVECGKKFTNSSNLQRHSRIHTGEKAYCCTECGKRFTDSSGLRRHIRVHTRENRYGCAECGKQFPDSSALQQHKQIHTGESDIGVLNVVKDSLITAVFRIT
ncbi:zinc finger protein 391-like [Polypterus senegalus]|uniref:zinc finger protein 391-like n=1 Tax=Polypterus senegalus TaxID=55291 RepID=UPI00196381CF|nr:zinc finger protein 391-like [Polypterus senegalus]XP_039608184.1 zinc finger protein 391-like [Polypterus senegalus]